MRTKRPLIYRKAARELMNNPFGGKTISGAIMKSRVGTSRVRINALNHFWKLYPEMGPFYTNQHHAPIALLVAAYMTPISKTDATL